jgi:acyl-CoA synthetase (AMP-forming)/AMP-acid ligase II
VLRRLEDIPASSARLRPQAIALREGTQAWSWSALDAKVRDLRRSLETLGVRPGDRVMLVGENCAGLVAAIFAVAGCDAWIVNVNARLTAREVDAILAHARPRVVAYFVSSPAAAEHAARVPTIAWDLGEWGEARIAGPFDADPEPLDEDPSHRVASLLYTTGTMGAPKGVMHTHASLIAMSANSARILGTGPDDHTYGLLPFSHVYGLGSVLLGALRAGASIELEARFTPAAMARALAERGITICHGVPVMFAKLLEHLRARGAAPRFPRLRALRAGGAPLALQLKRDVEAMLGLRLDNGYGMTEATPTIARLPDDPPCDDTSVGKPLPGIDVRIVDRGGADVAAGDIGELWVRGENVMKGYYRDPRATAESLRGGGWLATGDLARSAPDGSIFIEGRLKELIIHSGFNVFPAEVEAVLNAHPAVSQSAVVGRDVDGNEEVVAFVELHPGAAATPAALARHAAAALAPYKRPAEIIVLPVLPAAPSGKVLKARLKAWLRERSGEPLR